MQKVREMIQFDLFFIFFKCETKKQRFTNKFDDVSQGGMFFFFLNFAGGTPSGGVRWQGGELCWGYGSIKHTKSLVMVEWVVEALNNQ